MYEVVEVMKRMIAAAAITIGVLIFISFSMIKSSIAQDQVPFTKHIVTTKV